VAFELPLSITTASAPEHGRSYIISALDAQVERARAFDLVWNALGVLESALLVYVLFFLSGISGLIHQVVWVREFGSVFGNTVYSA